MTASPTITNITGKGNAPLPPGPLGAEKIAVLAKLARDPWFYPLELTKKYGDVVSLPTPFIKTVYLSHPDHVDHVLVKHADRYRRSDMVNKQMVPAQMGHNFFAFSDDIEWRRGRQLYRPSFSQKNLADLGDLFTESIIAQVDSWADFASTSEFFDLTEKTQELALIVLLNAMFDEYLSPRLLQAPATRNAIRSYMLAMTARVVMYGFPAWMPRPFQEKVHSQTATILGITDQIIEMRRRHPTNRTDILNLLTNAKYDDGSPLENGKIAVEILGMIIGGHETTAAGLAWTFALLAGHPDIEERLIAEVDALGGNPVTVADMINLRLVRACFDEALRLQGGLVINPKTALVDDEIGGYQISAGTTILYSSLAMHRDPRFWPNPNQFHPDRFLSNDADVRAFIPFGRGPRLCLGKQMAYIEAVLTIATAYQRYRFILQRGYTPRHQYRMSMGLRGGLPVRIAPREA